MSTNKEANELISQAKKKAAYSGWFGGNKFDEAADLYQRAANSYKISKDWKEAGDAFMEAAHLQLRLQEQEEASSSFINASKVFKKCNPQEAIKALQQAVQLLTEKGRFHTAANNQKEIASIYESDIVDIEQAMKSYEIAAEWYATEEAQALAQGCLLKVAHFAAQLEKYDRAVEIFEQVANASLDNQLAKWSLKDYFLKAGLCLMCTGDMVRANQAIEKYATLDMSFSSTREYQLLKSLAEAVEAGEVDQFTHHVTEYDRLSKLDNWKTTILLRIKKSISEEIHDLT